ncbi:DUF222 domain-containing protein [Aeromicrobium sp. CF4.19]|uniref:HNH endonuclease signature motif containing protein n=1 Tax=Aeromicrobium sp. CF4.19 TaxID=3373082 RepID=UPI003EE4A56F
MDPSGWAGLEDTVLRDSATRLARLRARLQGQEVAIARRLEASGAARRAGAGSIAEMLGKDFGGDHGEGHKTVRTAKALEQASRTEKALTAGRISMNQAKVIADGLATLGPDVTPEQRDLCERRLLKDARTLTLKDLRRRTDRATDAFKPEPEVDADENQRLKDRERDARRKSEFWMSDRGNGTHRGGFVLPDAQAEMLKAAVEAISAPRRDHLNNTDEATDAPQAQRSSVFDRELDHRARMGRGFADLCDHLPTDRLPAAGGVGAQLTINLDLETLQNGIKAATLSTGTRLSAGQARLTACRLGIIPMVLNGTSLPLDLGQSKRFFSKAQRMAMENRDGGCSFPGCDKPPQWCEAHHARTPWANGGTTDLADGVLICPAHHHVVHEQAWQIRFHPTDGTPEYRAPGSSTWQTNTRWRP